MFFRLHRDITSLTDVKPRNQGSPIQQSELNISGYDVFTNIEQIDTGGVCLYVSHNLLTSPLELEASNLFYVSVWAVIN